MNTALAAGGNASRFNQIFPSLKSSNRSGDAFKQERHTLDNLDPEAMQRRYMRRMIAQQANLADAQVRKDLPSQADLAQNTAFRTAPAFTVAAGFANSALFSVKLQAPRVAIDRKAPVRMMERVM